MTIYAMWHGGPSYAHGYIDSDVETFPTLAAARDALISRERSGYWFQQDFAFLTRPAESKFTPCVESSSMTIWLADPTRNPDPYPDRILSIGPRGGIRMERA